MRAKHSIHHCRGICPLTLPHTLPAVEAGVRGASQQVVQAYLGFKLGVWGYNGAVRFWEPVLEPWDVIAQCAANQGTRVSPLGRPKLCVLGLTGMGG
jgi:hypothetical protein